MLPLSGGMVSEAYLEGIIAGGAAHMDLLAVARRRDALRWSEISATLGPASSPRAMFEIGAEPLARLLGFDGATAIFAGPRTMAATLTGGDRPVALLVAPWGEPLEHLWREAVTEAMRRASSWCLVFNGTHLRIADASRTYTRRHVQFHLPHIAEDPRWFRAFWCLCGAPTLAIAVADGPRTRLHEIVDASDRHALGVCRSLRGGVLTASTEILGALTASGRGAVALDVAFEQALTIVYRLLFLLFAEARALVPIWHPVYRESYSVESLRTAVERPQGARGLWEALGAITRLAHAGCDAGDLHVTPFNGRLFAPARTPLAERRHMDDEAATRALRALSNRPASDGRGLEPIAYRDLGVEQLGAVYETLLDYTPRLAPPSRGAAQGGARRRRVSLEAGSHVRKSTGTFYTPQPIADYVVRRTLAPLVRDASPDAILRLRIVDPAMGSGAFLVAACRFLAGAYETALISAGGCHPSDIDAHERTLIRRTIAERCLYGVDLNPTAVQLARLSIWLATLAADRPLSFLDHRLRSGNSLLGAWIAALGRRPERAPRKRVAAGSPPFLFEELRVRDALRSTLPRRFSLESTPSDTIEQVRGKERSFAAIAAPTAPLGRWRQVADLWCASWLCDDVRKVPAAAFHDLSDAIVTGRGGLARDLTQQYLRAAEAIARDHTLFHWELEFPEVFFAGDGSRLPNGGFDAVLGNPPWDMLRADPDVAGKNPRQVVRFTRDTGVYSAQSDGHANSYQLFLERCVSLTRAGGRIGVVLPSGFATDRGSAPLRRLLMTRCRVDGLVGFENRRRVFPIHAGLRFLLLTGSNGGPTDAVACRFGVEDPADLESADDSPQAAWFSVRLTAALVERLSGEDLTIPWMRSPQDLVLAERAGTLFAPLGSDRGWGARFGRELNATDDRHHFCALEEPGALPVMEGKQIEPFGVELTTSRFGIRAADAERLLPRRWSRPRLAYRDVAGPNNRLTVIAAVLPRGCVSTHTLFCLRTRLSLLDQYLLCGLLNSFVVNYLARMLVSTHVTTALIERLPVPTRDDGQARAREVAALARSLTRGRTPHLHARLQAQVAALYQLTTDEFAYVLSTFPLVAQSERDAALALLSEDARP